MGHYLANYLCSLRPSANDRLLDHTKGADTQTTTCSPLHTSTAILNTSENMSEKTNQVYRKQNTKALGGTNFSNQLPSGWFGYATKTIAFHRLWS